MDHPKMKRAFDKLFSDANEQRGTDVKIICKDGTVHAHRNILRATSDYFEAMFSSDMQEDATNTVDFSRWSLGAVSEVVRQLYFQRPTETTDFEQLVEIASLSHMISEEEIFDRCWHEIQRSLNASNFVHVWKLCDVYRRKKDCVVGFLRANLDDISVTDLPEDIVREVLPNMPVVENAVRLLLRWTAADDGGRIGCAIATLSKMRTFSLWRCSVCDILTDPLMMEHRHLREALTQFLFFGNLDLRIVTNVGHDSYADTTFSLADCSPPSTKSYVFPTHRNVHGMQPVILKNGRLYFVGVRSRSVVVYDTWTCSEISGPSVGSLKDLNYGTAMQGVFIYFWFPKVYFGKFDTIRESWQELSIDNLPSRRHGFLVATCSKLFFVTEGSTESNLYEYLDSLDDWYLKSSFPNYIFDCVRLKCCTLHCKSTIYFCGTAADIENREDVVITYNLSDGSWNAKSVSIGELGSKRAVMVNCEEGAILYYSSGLFYLYYPETDTVRTVGAFKVRHFTSSFFELSSTL